MVEESQAEMNIYLMSISCAELRFHLTLKKNEIFTDEIKIPTDDL